MMKTYTVLYKYKGRPETLVPNIPFREIKKMFWRLLHDKDNGLAYIKIQERNAAKQAVFYPETGAMFSMDAIENPLSKIAVAILFQNGRAYIDRTKEKKS